MDGDRDTLRSAVLSWLALECAGLGDGAVEGLACQGVYEKVCSSVAQVIGNEGVHAVFIRSVQDINPALARTMVLREEAGRRLCEHLQQLDSPAIRETAVLMLLGFHDTLATLIGRSLAFRMMQSPWEQRLHSMAEAEETEQ